MNFQNDRYTLRLADASDDPGIRRIFESGSFPGGLDIRFLRGESPCSSFCADGDDAKILVIIDNADNTLAAVGGAVIREEFVNGEAARCAYLTGLKIHPDYRRQILFIPQAYRFLREEIADCRYTYTTILDGNADVIRMLEKKRRNMPEYRYLGHYTTYAFTHRRNGLRLDSDLSGYEETLHRYFAAQSLVPCRQDYPGFGKGRWYALHDQRELIACCYVGDQSAFKQYQLCHYGGMYRILSKLPTRLLGYPAFPREGTRIRHGVVSYLWVTGNHAELCKAFLQGVAGEAGYDLLLWGGFENHPLVPVLDRMKTVRYGSRLYQVCWEDSTVPIGGTIGMEAALL